MAKVSVRTAFTDKKDKSHSLIKEHHELEEASKGFDVRCLTPTRMLDKKHYIKRTDYLQKSDFYSFTTYINSVTVGTIVKPHSL